MARNRSLSPQTVAVLRALARQTAAWRYGYELGQDLVTVDDYLKRVNPQIPQIVRDLRLTTQVSNTYADVMPSVAQILRNTIKTTGTLEDRHQQLQTLFSDVTSFSDTAHDFLRDNGDNIIRLGQVSAPQARLLGRYSPEYPCLLHALRRQDAVWLAAPQRPVPPGQLEPAFPAHTELVTCD